MWRSQEHVPQNIQHRWCQLGRKYQTWQQMLQEKQKVVLIYLAMVARCLVQLQLCQHISWCRLSIVPLCIIWANRAAVKRLPKPFQFSKFTGCEYGGPCSGILPSNSAVASYLHVNILVARCKKHIHQQQRFQQLDSQQQTEKRSTTFVTMLDQSTQCNSMEWRPEQRRPPIHSKYVNMQY